MHLVTGIGVGENLRVFFLYKRLFTLTMGVETYIPLFESNIKYLSRTILLSDIYHRLIHFS